MWRGMMDLMTFNFQNGKIFNLFKMSKCIFKNIKHYFKVIYRFLKSFLIVNSNSPSVPSEPDILRVLLKMERNRSFPVSISLLYSACQATCLPPQCKPGRQLCYLTMKNK